MAVMEHANSNLDEAEEWILTTFKEAERRVRRVYLAELRRMEKAERGLMRQTGLNLAMTARYRERADALRGAIRALESLPPTLPE